MARILVVDDEEFLCVLMANALKPFGHEVETAPNGREGLEKFQTAQRDKNPFDLVATDLAMPLMNGLEMTDAIKEARPEIPVIVSSGYYVGRPDLRQPDLVLEKPLTLANIRGAIDQLLGVGPSGSA